MKKVSLIATIGCGVILFLRVFGFIRTIQWVSSDSFDEYSRSFFNGAFFNIASGLLGICAWALIGWFFLTLYKKQPK